MSGDAQRAGMLIKQISEQVDKKINMDMKECNITSSQMRVLLFIAKSKSTVSQKDIEVFLQVAHPTVVGILSGLEEKGLVKCAFDAADKRRKNAYLTDSAKKVLCLARRHGEMMGAKSFADFSEEEIKTLVRLLEKMQENIKNFD